MRLWVSHDAIFRVTVLTNPPTVNSHAVATDGACTPVCLPLPQVLDLGITRMLVHRLVRVFPHVCEHHFMAAGSTKAACRICNRRFEEMGRRSQASTVAPGYVLHPLGAPSTVLEPSSDFSGSSRTAKPQRPFSSLGVGVAESAGLPTPFHAPAAAVASAAARVSPTAGMHLWFPSDYALGSSTREHSVTPELTPQLLRLCRENQSLRLFWKAVTNDRGVPSLICHSCPVSECHGSSPTTFRYMVAADELQANFTGRKQRNGVFILPHAVPKVFALGRLKPRTASGHMSDDDDEESPRVPLSGRGRPSGVRAQSGKRLSRPQAPTKSAPAATDRAGADAQTVTFDAGLDSDDELPKCFMFDWGAYKKVWGETPYEDAVTELFSEYAVLYGRVAGLTMARAPASMTLQEAKSLQDHAREFIDKYVRPILGEVHTPKVHKLLRKLLDAIKMHGNLNNGSVGSNEAGHKVD